VRRQSRRTDDEHRRAREHAVHEEAPERWRAKSTARHTLTNAESNLRRECVFAASSRVTPRTRFIVEKRPSSALARSQTGTSDGCSSCRCTARLAQKALALGRAEHGDARGTVRVEIGWIA